MITDILDVSPNNGSTEGGTNISITVNAPLANYSMEDMKVLVGGMVVCGPHAINHYHAHACRSSL